MTHLRKTFLSLSLVAIAVVGAVWFELHSTSTYESVSAGAYAGDEHDRLMYRYEREVGAVRSTLVTTTLYAASVTVLSVAAVLVLWKKRPSEGEEDEGDTPPAIETKTP